MDDLISPLGSLAVLLALEMMVRDVIGMMLHSVLSIVARVSTLPAAVPGGTRVFSLGGISAMAINPISGLVIMEIVTRITIRIINILLGIGRLLLLPVWTKICSRKL
jgi:hypothetical protein